MGVVELGFTVRRARLQRELSYADVRDRSGLAKSHLQRLERGEIGEPSPSVLRKLAGALELDYHGLLREAGYL